MQRVASYVPPVWPGTSIVHLTSPLMISASPQSKRSRWELLSRRSRTHAGRVLLDPAPTNAEVAATLEALVELAQALPPAR
ncbi:hypothetical protein [Cryptosporangium minutisporangium]|uniref:Uncharacterized protein n=1 Tax=Cryptosporangium minutisporangium TaxID=113569 RepID=A0ABP6TDC2_9ACTN